MQFASGTSVSVLELAIERALLRRDPNDARAEVEVRAGSQRGRGGDFVPGVTQSEFDDILMHVGDPRAGWEVAQRWRMSFDYAARLPPGVVQPFTLRVETVSIEPDLNDRRVLTAFPSTRTERVVARSVRKERLSAEIVHEAHARVACALEHEAKPFQLYVDCALVRAKVRLSVQQRGWRLDLTRVWQATSRSAIDHALRERAPPTALEVELEAVAPGANARDAAALWTSLPPFKLARGSSETQPAAAHNDDDDATNVSCEATTADATTADATDSSNDSHDSHESSDSSASSGACSDDSDL